LIDILAYIANGDEVLLVGHSIGGALAMRAFKAASSDALLLTVGQSIPLVSFQAEAGDLRDDIEAVRHAERPWIDVSAGRDPLLMNLQLRHDLMLRKHVQGQVSEMDGFSVSIAVKGSLI